MRTLFVHVGGPKSGSTLLQHHFALARDVLLEGGVDYPRRGDGWGTANSMGNVPDLHRNLQALAETVDLADPRAAHGVLLSSELLFRTYGDDPAAMPALTTAARALGFGRVKLILAVRDPLDLAPSVWQQWVRGVRHIADPLDEWTAEVFPDPRIAADLLARAADMPGLEIDVFNFSRWRGQAPLRVFRALELDAATAGRAAETAVAAAGEARAVNSSLSSGECAFLLGWNGVTPKDWGHLRPYPFLAAVPHRITRPRRPSRAAQQAALQRLAPALDALDAALPPEERLSRDLREGDEGPQIHELTDDQLAELGRLAGRRAAELAAARDEALAEAAALRRRIAQLEPAARRHDRLRDAVPAPLRRLLRFAR